MQADPRAEFLRLTTIEDPGCGLHRIAMLEIAGALRHLAEPGPDAAASIHECRKAIKRLRALARLARRRDPASVRRLDRLLRRAGRSLSGQRDADVVVATARGIEPSRVTGAVAAALQSISAHGLSGDAARAASALGQARRHFEQLFDLAGTWRPDELMDAVVGEFGKLQRRGCRYLGSQTERDAHQLRKSVQRCLAQLRVLSSVTEADVDARIRLLNDLAQKLGKHHDLTVLRSTLKSVPESTLSKSDRRHLRRTARERQLAIDADINEVLPDVVGASPDALRSELVGDLTIDTPAGIGPATIGSAGTDATTDAPAEAEPQDARITSLRGFGGAHGGD